MISWKHSFKRLNEEYEMAKKKKQALDNLLSSGKISQSTHGLFNDEIASAVSEIEMQQRALLEKMNSKIGELEGQIKTLEMLLANFEIQHVTGEVEEEVYKREIDLLSMGLEVARQELDAVKEVANQLSDRAQVPVAEIVEPQKVECAESSSEAVIEVKEEVVQVKEAEEAPKESVEQKAEESPPVEAVKVSDAGLFQNQQETTQGKEEAQPTETVTEEKKQE